ncbi:contractile injection system protein, VgrG/Pvc8 family [Kaistia dalseonensis]|uniref:Prophage tail gpP-like protein n=1 Tax=Kaistia dalseonensis TaxID=410840 RepID=A0ABU0HC05_9HYPH|nr:contractile injection system protein, VgrG/Pvc8 family [Kaistia dalseonensis]MCX5496429.1 contractile injection system protein, VgrG/Pvc8 family [Kaistia dalseonensis]MDQ0439049.1 prophage tail gpP-like protein [Kaistia dalseonensis]
MSTGFVDSSDPGAAGIGSLPLSAAMMPAAGGEVCQVYCNGQIFEGWTRVSVVRSVQGAASRFRLTVTEANDAAGAVLAWQIRCGDPISIKLGGVKALTGYVDVRQAAYDAENHGVEIEGRSLTQDVIDSSAVKKDGGPVGPYRGYKLDEIVRALLSPFGIGLRIIGDVGAAIPMVSVQFGETIFEVIERLARLRGFNIHDDADGNLVLARSAKTTLSAGLVEGVNIKRANGTQDVSQVVSDLFIAGSTTGDDDASGADVSGESAKASNGNVQRYRPRAMMLEQPGTKDDMKVRANREMAQLAADTARVSVTVYGWRMADGRLWEPRDVVQVTSPMLLIDRQMAVFSVEFTQDDQGGTESILDLVVPESLDPNAPADQATPPSTEDGSDGGDAGEDTVADNWSIRSTGAAA